jgi:HSP20 family protein
MGKRKYDKNSVVYRFHRNFQDSLEGPFRDDKVHEPYVDIYETPEHLRVEVELPGVKKQDIKAYILENRLHISAVKKDDFKQDPGSRKREFLCLEREFGEFYREIDLPVPCVNNKIKAKFEDGVLTVECPKLLDRRGQKTNLAID